jgi:hypothetical protein
MHINTYIHIHILTHIHTFIYIYIHGYGTCSSFGAAGFALKQVFAL